MTQRLPIIEEHYILMGYDRYQVVFDAKIDKHDILIRALFHWDAMNETQVKKIECILDNLSTVPTTHVIDKVLWCDELNRVELHIKRDSAGDLRTSKPLVLTNGFDFKKEKQMDVLLRICDENETIKECNDLDARDKEKDKDGAILIGSTITPL